MSNIAVLTWERWINPESCTPERDITLADLKKKIVPWEHTIDWKIKSHGFKLQCVTSFVVDYDA